MTDSSPAASAMERNLHWYGRMQLPAHAFFWLPTSVLFFIDEFGLADALRLQAIYYFAVVVFEVPSGWFSDRVGRVLTLRLAACWWLVAHLLFLGGGQFATIAAAQVFLAMGFASISGTDVTLHYDSLEALDRSGDFEDREAHVRRNSLIVTAVTALVGGALAVSSLRLPFAAALGASALHLGFALQLREPPRHTTTTRFHHDVLSVLRRFRVPILGWLLLYVVAEVVLVHLASEIAAPYLADALGEDLSELDQAPLLNGALAAAVALGGAAVVRRVGWLRRTFGLLGGLTVIAAVPTTIVVLMALVSSLWLLPVLALRNVQAVMAPVLVAGEVGERVPREERATFLSLTSLGGRLTYGGVLLVLSTAGGLTTTLRWAAVIALGFMAAVWLTSVFVGSDDVA